MTHPESWVAPAPTITEVVDTDYMFAPLAPPVPERPSQRRLARLRPPRLALRTLTGRLVAGVVALVIVIVTVVGCATYYSLKPFLEDRLDQQVSALASSQNALTQYTYGISNPTAVGGPVDVWLAIVGQDGKISATLQDTGQSLHNMDLRQRDAVALLAHPGRPTTIRTADGTELVAATSSTNLAHLDPRLLGSFAILGLSTDGVHETLHRLIVLELLLGTAAVLLAALLTSYGVRAGLRPLKRVTRTAQEVTAELGPDGGGLQRRVPGPEDHTEVGQVASSINVLLETVQREFNARVASEERMRQFLADASHELRTPLTSIRGYAELSRLTGGAKDADDPMHRIEVEGTRMSRLVEDLLVLARGDQDSLTAHEPVRVDAVLAEAANVVSAAHPERTIEVYAQTGATVIGDHDQLVRALVNLVNNAAVHTAPDKPIHVDGLLGHTDTGPAVALRVMDAGPGLAPEEAAHVFERFWRADKARSRVKGGSGLGMAIVAQIVDSHGGQVRFDSSVESGTTVTITLPLPVRPGPAAIAVQELPAARQN